MKVRTCERFLSASGLGAVFFHTLRVKQRGCFFVFFHSAEHTTGTAFVFFHRAERTTGTAGTSGAHAHPELRLRQEREALVTVRCW